MPAPAASRLDANQVLQGAFDESSGRLRTDAEATIVNADIDVSINAAEDSVTSYTVDENGNPFTDANYLPAGQTTHDNLNANANLQVGNVDVGAGNPVPVAGPTLLSIEEKVYNLTNYLIQDVDEVPGTLYAGAVLVDGTYLIKKIAQTGGLTSIRYANISNNASKTTYLQAWTDRATINYTYLYTLSNV